MALILEASNLTTVLSQYSGNYVTMLLKVIPLTVFGLLVTTCAFYFGNYIIRFLVLPGGESLCAAPPTVLGPVMGQAQNQPLENYATINKENLVRFEMRSKALVLRRFSHGVHLTQHFYDFS